MKKNTKLREKVEFKTVKELIEKTCEKYKDDYVHVFKNSPRDKELTKIKYEQLIEDVRGLATEFIARGYKDKHIALIGKLSYPWICVYWATLSIGSVLVPLDPEWTSEDLSDTLTKADACAVCIGKDIKDKADIISEKTGISSFVVLEGDEDNTIKALVDAGKKKIEDGDRSYFETDPDPDKMGLLVFTSGTTGKGKGVYYRCSAYQPSSRSLLP